MCMQDKPHHARRHKRSQTVLDGSPPVPEPKQAAQQQAQQPPSQPATPLRRALWGSRAAAAPEQAAPEAAGPSPYAACDPFDVVMMRCGASAGPSPVSSLVTWWLHFACWCRDIVLVRW
jgi:hypothetical protein